MNGIQKIVTYLWFDKECEEAINYYVSVFNGSPHKLPESRIISISRHEPGLQYEPDIQPLMDQMWGKVLTAVFELAGQRFMALDGGPVFQFNEALSLYVECEDQQDVDYFWSKLSAVPEAEACGWCKDKFGLSWQIVPKQWDELMNSPNRKKAIAAMNALLQMKKLVIADLQRAFDEA